MSTTRTVISNFLFGAVCAFFGFVVSVRLLVQLAFRGKRTVLHVRPRPSPPACLLDSQLGRHNYVKLKDVRLHYVEAGDQTNKPLLLCLHGFPEFWYSWRYQLQEFSGDFWVVAVDMRGYGDSDKPSGVGAYTTEKLLGDVEQLILALGRRSCVLMGHDRGGIIAWMFAEKFPHMVERLIVLNAPHPGAFVKLLRSSIRQFLKSWFLFFVQLPYLPEVYFRCNDLGFIDDTFRSNTSSCRRTGRPTFCDHDVEAYKYTFGSPGAFTGPLNHFRNLRSSIVNGVMIDGDVRRRRRASAQVSVPVLILWGSDDSSFLGPVSLAHMSRDDYVERTVECTVHLIKGAGHFVQQDSPVVVNGHIRQFLIDYVMSRAASDESDGSPVDRGGTVHSLVGRVRDCFVSSVSSSAFKLSSKVPPVLLGQLSHALNRKLLSS